METIQINGVSYIKADDVFKAAGRDIRPFDTADSALIVDVLLSFSRVPKKKQSDFKTLVHYLQYANKPEDACFADHVLRDTFASLMGDGEWNDKGEFIYNAETCERWNKKGS